MYHAIVFLPLIGFLLAGMFGKTIGAKGAEYVTSGFLIIAALLSWIAFITVGLGGGEPQSIQVLRWINSGSLNINWAFRIDTLTVVMLVVVNGEIDPPYTDGDDRIQDLSQDFNSQRERDYMNENPGLVQALVTVIVAKGVPDDTTVQLWEKVMMRVYNNDDKDKATHYIDTEPWESQPGFWTITPNEAPVGEWKKIHKN